MPVETMVFILTIVNVMLMTTCWPSYASTQAERNTVKEYCGFETFHPKCWGKEVIVMDVAIYGRRQVGRCIRASDVEELGDSRFIGCFTDTIALVDARCSGKQECEIRIPDPQLQQATTCPLQSLAMYLEASYSCVEVVEEDRSCVVSVTPTSLHIASHAASSESVGLLTLGNGHRCGTKNQPWLLEAPAGQRINISLFDFSQNTTALSDKVARDSMNRDRIRSSKHSARIRSGSCSGPQYGFIIDKLSSVNKNTSVCGSLGSRRLTNAYVSTSNSVELVLTSKEQQTETTQQSNFLIRLEAIGCTNLVPPEDAWIKRDDDKITIGCYTSRQTWQLRCQDGRWIGVVSNCTQTAFLIKGESDAVNKQLLDSIETNHYEVLVVVAVSFTGLAICLTIVCCGIVCLKRFQVLQRKRSTLTKESLNDSRMSYEAHTKLNC